MIEDKCPKCGADRLGYGSYKCGTEDGPNGTLDQGEHCRDRCDLVQLRKTIATIREEASKFKAYVHQRLDEAGVPYEVPESPHTATGCRIGGRLDWVLNKDQP